MSTPTSEATALPVTGSGPFTLLVGLIGVIAVGAGSLLRRISTRT